MLHCNQAAHSPEPWASSMKVNVAMGADALMRMENKSNMWRQKGAYCLLAIWAKS